MNHKNVSILSSQRSRFDKLKIHFIPSLTFSSLCPTYMFSNSGPFTLENDKHDQH